MFEKVYVTPEQIVTPDCSVECQETVISWGRKDELAAIFTSDPTTVTRMKNLMKEDPTIRCFYYAKNIVPESGRPTAYQFECDKSQVCIRRFVEKRELTDEQKAAVAKRLKKINSN